MRVALSIYKDWLRCEDIDFVRLLDRRGEDGALVWSAASTAASFQRQQQQRLGVVPTGAGGPVPPAPPAPEAPEVEDLRGRRPWKEVQHVPVFPFHLIEAKQIAEEKALNRAAKRMRNSGGRGGEEVQPRVLSSDAFVLPNGMERELWSAQFNAQGFDKLGGADGRSWQHSARADFTLLRDGEAVPLLEQRSGITPIPSGRASSRQPRTPPSQSPAGFFHAELTMSGVVIVVTK